jgi:hypothetical protein
MTEITLELDSRASESMKELMDYYHVRSRAELISKAIAMLKLAAHIHKTGGELYARKEQHETKLIV